MRQLGAVVARLGGLAVVRMQLSVVSTELVTADTECTELVTAALQHSCLTTCRHDNMLPLNMMQYFQFQKKISCTEGKA